MNLTDSIRRQAPEFTTVHELMTTLSKVPIDARGMPVTILTKEGNVVKDIGLKMIGITAGRDGEEPSADKESVMVLRMTPYGVEDKDLSYHEPREPK